MGGHEQGRYVQAKLSKQARWSRRREVKYDKGLDLFSATPPLEALKFLCSKCARGQTRLEPRRFAVIYIKRSYFYASVRRPIFIEIPKEGLELGDEGCEGQLQLSLYGTR